MQHVCNTFGPLYPAGRNKWSGTHVRRVFKRLIGGQRLRARLGNTQPYTDFQASFKVRHWCDGGSESCASDSGVSESAISDSGVSDSGVSESCVSESAISDSGVSERAVLARERC